MIQRIGQAKLMTEEQQFRVLLGFLGRMGGEVSGRIAVAPDLDDRLRLFANGSLARRQQEQDQLLTEIAADSAAMNRLAEYLKN